MKKSLILLSVCLFIFSCSKDKSENLIEGICTINSDLESAPTQSEGFSVEQGGIITYPNSEMIIPDFKLQTYGSLEINRIQFISLTNRSTFVFINEAVSLDSASAQFENYSDTNKEFEDGAYETIPFLSENQIWLIKSINNIYYKIQILETELFYNEMSENDNSYHSVYGHVTFKWKKLKSEQ